MKRKSVLYSIISISALGIVAKVMGLLREGVVAAYFGTSSEMDVFGLLSGYATMLMAVIAGALATSFAPYYIKDLQQKGEKLAAERFSHTLNQYVLFSFSFFCLIWVASPWLTKVMCQHLVESDADIMLLYIRLLFATVITGGMSRLFVSALNGLRKYGWMQITQIFYSVLTIILTIAFGCKYGVGVLVAAFVLNSVVQVTVLWAVFFQKERKFSFVLGLEDSVTCESWKTIVPVFFGSEIYMLGLAIDRTIGLSLNMEGAAAALNYAGILFGLINMVVTSPIGTVFNTEMYRNYYKTEDRNVLYQDLAKIINHQAIILLPLGFFLFADNSYFISFVLKRGAFDDKSVAITSSAFCMYALSAPVFALRSVFTGVHIAMQDRMTPMWSGILFLIMNVTLSFSFSHILGITGITLGAFCAMIASFGFQYYSIIRKHECRQPLFTITYVKILFAAITAAGPIFFFTRMGMVASPYIRFFICAVAYCLIFMSILQATHCSEFLLLKQRINLKTKL